MPTKLNKAEEMEKFNQYLFELSEKIDLLKDEARRAGFQLDDSLESLNELEKFYLALIAQKAPAELLERVELLAPGYIGEVARKNYGGKWALNIENPRHLYYGNPVIENICQEFPSLEVSPFFIFNGFKVRKIPGLIAKSVRAVAKPKAPK